VLGGIHNRHAFSHYALCSEMLIGDVESLMSGGTWVMTRVVRGLTATCLFGEAAPAAARGQRATSLRGGLAATGVAS